MIFINTTALAILLVFCFSQPAYAYLDPGTGSMLVSALVGIAATLFFLLKGVWYRGIGYLYTMFGKKMNQTKNTIVFYSEGKQYWYTFKPIIDALSQKGESCSYLTSDENDPGLTYQTNGLTTRFVGTGEKAFAAMNMLEASLCAMTTPGLGVLQIRRSPGVNHYAHIVHAAGDVSLYRLYGLDYYDSVLSSGPHQEQSIRELENLRNTTPKTILKSGCPYFDILLDKKNKMKHDDTQSKGEHHILVAPTWGKSGLLTCYGIKLLQPLAEAGYHVTVRPHPQSLIVEKQLLTQLEVETACYKNITWDYSSDNFLALSEADVLISDFSSITFDFAFIMECPVLTMDFVPDILPYDAYDLKSLPWDFTVQPQLGKKITLNDVPNIPQIVAELLSQPDFKIKLKAFREQNVYNFGKAGPVIADQLIKLRNECLAK